MDLGEWILDHQVCWEIRPRYEKLAHSVERAGFQLELFARGPSLADDPGSAECRAVYEGLGAVARLALPAELRPVVFVPFDRAFHLVPGKELLPEIELLVDIGPSRSPSHGESERAIQKQLEDQLRRIGVRQRGEPPVERRRARLVSVPAGTGCGAAQGSFRTTQPGPPRDRHVESPGEMRWVA